MFFINVCYKEQNVNWCISGIWSEKCYAKIQSVSFKRKEIDNIIFSDFIHNLAITSANFQILSFFGWNPRHVQLALNSQYIYTRLYKAIGTSYGNK